MYWIDHRGTDPAFNLALEEVLLDRVEAGHPGFAMLWQNRPTIVVGRFQNARQEINPDFVREKGIEVVRRMTGGGAVYHDAGTLNYTFIHHLENKGELPSFREAGKPIADALRALGLPVTFSGRNDLMLDGRKVAGVAHCRRGAAFLHHGCILVNSELDVLGEALRADPEKFQSKGVASVRARVTNLADAMPISVDGTRAGILSLCDGEPYTPSPALLDEAAKLREAKYASWDWTYGASPPFNERLAKRFPWGKLEVFFEVRAGRIEACRFFGDFFMSAHNAGQDVTDLEKALCGVPYAADAMAPVLAAFPLEDLFNGCDAEELKSFLLPA